MPVISNRLRKRRSAGCSESAAHQEGSAPSKLSREVHGGFARAIPVASSGSGGHFSHGGVAGRADAQAPAEARRGPRNRLESPPDPQRRHLSDRTEIRNRR